MTKQLQELFDLPPSEIPTENSVSVSPVKTPEEITTTAAETLDKINEALPQVRGLDSSDNELDELAAMATSSYRDLIDLGMQVDSRFASEIFNSASSMLGHAITAKTAKINKKLKMLDLQLKTAQLEQKKTSKVEELENTPLGEGRALDRNELLKMLLDKNQASGDK